MSWISEEDLKTIRQRADIVDVMSQYLTLNKKGKNYTAVCPFHDDHDPSLSISTDKQIYKCFVCGAGGNVFSFVQKMEEISFPEAVYKVAHIIGYPLSSPNMVYERKENKNQKYFDLIQSFIQYTNYELRSSDGMLAKQYLHDRKINDAIIDYFQIGYAPSKDRVIQFFEAKNYDTQSLENVGLVRSEMGNSFAIFHDRITIPIYDENGNPIGFTARTLQPSEFDPKYINTSTTQIYEKGNIVFNYHRAKEVARKKHRCILVEGAMDVIAFAKADIHECVACLGTACTSFQAELLKKLHVPIVICYDGDQAGKNATYKFGKIAMEFGIPFEIVKNNSNRDPDEIFNEYGRDELCSFVKKTISYIDFLFDYLLSKYNLDNYEEKKKYAQELVDVINKTCDSFEKNTFYARIKNVTGFDFSQTEKKTSRLNHKVVEPVYMNQPESGRLSAEKAVLSMILLSKDAASQFKDEIGFFMDSTCNQLSLYCFDLYRKNDRIDFDELLSKIDEEQVRDLLTSLIMDTSAPLEFNNDYFEDSLNKIKECSFQEQIDLINSQIKNISNPLEKAKKALQKKELIILKNKIRRKEG